MVCCTMTPLKKPRVVMLHNIQPKESQRKKLRNHHGEISYTVQFHHTKGPACCHVHGTIDRRPLTTVTALFTYASKARFQLPSPWLMRCERDTMGIPKSDLYPKACPPTLPFRPPARDSSTSPKMTNLDASPASSGEQHHHVSDQWCNN